MAKVKFIINAIKHEIEIANMAREYADFFNENKIRFTWPEKHVKEEYDIKKYETFRRNIESGWMEKEQNFTDRLLTFFQKTDNTQFTVEVSNYGPLGFYNANNNTITININIYPVNPTDTIKHEMVHIMVEPFIKTYNIQHKEKEHIVNTILSIL